MNNPDTTVGHGQLTLLLKLVEDDIRREGEASSSMVRAGLLRDIINELIERREQPQ